MPAPTIEEVRAAAQHFRKCLQMHGGMRVDEADKRTCKELLAHGMVQHKHNQLLVQACEIIDDFLIASAAFPNAGAE